MPGHRRPTPEPPIDGWKVRVWVAQNGDKFATELAKAVVADLDAARTYVEQTAVGRNHFSGTIDNEDGFVWAQAIPGHLIEDRAHRTHVHRPSATETIQVAVFTENGALGMWMPQTAIGAPALVSMTQPTL